MKSIVFFHANCNDGLFSGFNMWKALGNEKAIYIPINYNPINTMLPQEAMTYLLNPESYSQDQEFNSQLKLTDFDINDLSSTDIYFVDFAPNPNLFTWLMTRVSNVIVYDHHATAMDKYAEAFSSAKTVDTDELVTYTLTTGVVTFSKKDSGALLTFKQMFPTACPIPKYLQYSSDYDTWQFKITNSLYFVYGMKVRGISNFVKLELTMLYDIEDVISQGRCYYETILKEFKSIKKSGIEVNINIDDKEYTALLINYTGKDFSLLGEYIYSTYDIAVMWGVQRDGNCLCSVRSKKGVPSVKLSEKYHGGGHLEASGFKTDLITMNHWITNKQIEV